MNRTISRSNSSQEIFSILVNTNISDDSLESSDNGTHRIIITKQNGSCLMSELQSSDSDDNLKMTDEYGFNVFINIIKVNKDVGRRKKIIPFFAQNSDGERIFMISPNKMFSLRANVNGDLFILTSYGQVCWIHHSRNKSEIYGTPFLELSNYGELIFSIDDNVIFSSERREKSDKSKLELTNYGELILERNQTFINVDTYRRTSVTKNIQTVIFKSIYVR